MQFVAHESWLYDQRILQVSLGSLGDTIKSVLPETVEEGDWLSGSQASPFPNSGDHSA